MTSAALFITDRYRPLFRGRKMAALQCRQKGQSPSRPRKQVYPWLCFQSWCQQKLPVPPQHSCQMYPSHHKYEKRYKHKNSWKPNPRPRSLGRCGKPGVAAAEALVQRATHTIFWIPSSDFVIYIPSEEARVRLLRRPVVICVRVVSIPDFRGGLLCVLAARFLWQLDRKRNRQNLEAVPFSIDPLYLHLIPTWYLL